MRLSIIICVYNTAESYLAECLESIRRSTLKEIEDDYEICLVDDGSTVDYSALIKTYNPNYLKTENRGILSARKTGVELASGEYVIFCDSDDTVSFNYHLPMLKKAENDGADIVINDWAFHTARMRYFLKKDDTIKQNLNLSKDEKLFAFFKNQGRQHSYYVLWNKLYKKTLLENAFKCLVDSSYPESSSYSEDVILNFFAWRDAVNIVNIHTGYYFYRQHPTQTVNPNEKRKLLRQINCMVASFDIMRSCIEQETDNKYKCEILENINKWSALMSRAHYAAAISIGCEELFYTIKEKYDVDVLQRSTLRDCSDYIGTALLGNNFEEIDSALFSVWESKNTAKISYKKRDAYTARCVKMLVTENKAQISSKRDADVVIPRAKSSWKMKLIHNGFFYKIGVMFFKKGSRIRNFLKKFI